MLAVASCFPYVVNQFFLFTRFYQKAEQAFVARESVSLRSVGAASTNFLASSRLFR